MDVPPAYPSTPIRQPARPDIDAIQLLKFAMDRYASAKYMRIHYRLDPALANQMASIAPSATAPTHDRQLTYLAPNLYKVTADNSHRLHSRLTCDGTTVVETSDHPKGPKGTYPATNGIYQAPGTLVHSPIWGGSPMFSLFAGSGHFSSMVRADLGPVYFKQKNVAGDHETRHWVCFPSRDFGVVETLIGEHSGFAYEFKYRSAATGEHVESFEKIRNALSDNPFTNGQAENSSHNPFVNKVLGGLINIAKDELHRAESGPDGYKVRNLEQTITKVAIAIADGMLHEFHDFPTDLRPVTPQECAIGSF